MQITFYGAAGAVTGSKHLITTDDGVRLLLDCGLHQGKRHEADALNREFPFDAKALTAVMLSHAHADHCGMLPMLKMAGYQGSIYTTSTTADLARLIMLDSAKLQLHDFQYMQENPVGGEAPIPPLYSVDDVEAVSADFKTIECSRGSDIWFNFNPQTRVKLYDAGHILGSAITVIENTVAGMTKRIAFTGDLGNTNVPLLREPEVPTEEIETLLIECTYGDKLHRPMSEVDLHLKEIITDAVKNKRKIIVPAFALGRTQELLYTLHKLYDAGEIPVIPIYVDSPLGNEITEVFMKHTEDYDQETWTDFGSKHESPFAFTNLMTIRTTEESKALNTKPGPFMVIASSGMCEGGKVLHHLEHNVSNPDSVIILTGFQAENTLGRKLQEGVSPVMIYDRAYAVRARVITVSEFSAHADQQGLYDFVSKIKGLKRVFLVHTEMPQAAAFSAVLNERMPALQVVTPKAGESFDIE